MAADEGNEGQVCRQVVKSGGWEELRTTVEGGGNVRTNRKNDAGGFTTDMTTVATDGSSDTLSNFAALLIHSTIKTFLAYVDETRYISFQMSLFFK